MLQVKPVFIMYRVCDIIVCLAVMCIHIAHIPLVFVYIRGSVSLCHIMCKLVSLQLLLGYAAQKTHPGVSPEF